MTQQRDIPTQNILDPVFRHMAVDDKEITALRRLGLTEYESRIYLVLVKMGPVKASEASFFGQIPRTKTYGAIKELERKGLLQVIPGKPEAYAPRSPSEVLMPLVSRLGREVAEAEELVQGLAMSYESSKFVKRDVPKESTQFWELDGRPNLYNKLNQIFADSTKSINYCTSANGLIRIYKAHAEVLEKARRHGSRVRILSPVNRESATVAEQMHEIVEFKILDKPFLENFVAVDGRELIVIDSKPEDLWTDRGMDEAIWTTNRLLVELHDQLFERVWNGLPQARVLAK